VLKAGAVALPPPPQPESSKLAVASETKIFLGCLEEREREKSLVDNFYHLKTPFTILRFCKKIVLI